MVPVFTFSIARPPCDDLIGRFMLPHSSRAGRSPTGYRVYGTGNFKPAGLKGIRPTALFSFPRFGPARAVDEAASGRLTCLEQWPYACRLVLFLPEPIDDLQTF